MSKTTPEEAEFESYVGTINRTPEYFSTKADLKINSIPERLWERLAERCESVKEALYGQDELEEEKEEKKKEYVVMSKFSPVPFAEELMKSYKFKYDKNNILWVYNNHGLWTNDAEQFIRTTLRQQLMGDEQQKKNYMEEIVAHIKDISWDNEFQMDNFPYLIPFKNKVYNLKEGKFVDFKPEHYLSNKLDLDIDEEVTECPNVDKFFEESVGEEYKNILYELIAYSLFKEIPYQKIFFIYGPAGTGKSIFMSLFEHFLGSKNRCSVEPKRIQRDIHSTSEMEYKYANIVSDIDYDEFENINQVKKLSGNDSVTIRRMYKNPYSAKLYTKQIFSTNKLPVVKEKTKAWYRRVYLIEFANIIAPENRDFFLLDKLKQPNEMKGLAYKCLQTLHELYKKDFVFTWDMDEDAMVDIYEELSNPILMYINEHCTESRDGYVFKYDFEERLNNWLSSNHFPKATKTEINKYMREKYTESNRDSPVGNKKWRVFVGLRWKEKGDDSKDSFFNQFNRFNQFKKKLYIRRGIFQTPINPLKPLSKEKEVKNDES